MSTIIYKDGVMLADSRAWTGKYQSPMGWKVKTRRLNDGTLIGCSTNNVGASEYMLNWIEREEEASEIHNGITDYSILKVTPNGEAFKYFDTPFPAGPFHNNFYCIGSGQDFAYGALMAGASLLQAMDIAIDCDPMSAYPILKRAHADIDAVWIERNQLTFQE